MFRDSEDSSDDPDEKISIEESETYRADTISSKLSLEFGVPLDPPAFVGLLTSPARKSKDPHNRDLASSAGKAADLRQSGERSDLTVVVGQKRFSLHSFPMMCHSDYFAALLRSQMSDSQNLHLIDFPGGESTMDLLADFCYQISIDDKLTVDNIGLVICAAHYLQMNEFVSKFLPKLRAIANKSMSNCWRILAQCADVMHIAEEAQVAVTCISSLVNHWNRIDSHGTTKKETVEKWVIEMSTLPLEWITSILAAAAKDPLLASRQLPAVLTDQFLNFLVSQGSLDGAQFLLLLTSTESSNNISIPRYSFDSTFGALEKAAARKKGETNRFLDQDISNIVQKIDFTRVSQDVLERASKNERIPQRVILDAALAVCSALRQAPTTTAKDTALDDTIRLFNNQQWRNGEHTVMHFRSMKQDTTAVKTGSEQVRVRMSDDRHVRSNDFTLQSTSVYRFDVHPSSSIETGGRSRSKGSTKSAGNQVSVMFVDPVTKKYWTSESGASWCQVNSHINLSNKSFVNKSVFSEYNSEETLQHPL